MRCLFIIRSISFDGVNTWVNSAFDIILGIKDILYNNKIIYIYIKYSLK
jgi:hypothetical protein